MGYTRFRFFHQRLDVYQVAVEFVAYVEELDPAWFRSRADRRRQLEEAADSIALNIAEGCARKAVGARKNHYGIALGSAGECDAILEILEAKGCRVVKGRDLLGRIGAMLSRLC